MNQIAVADSLALPESLELRAITQNHNQTLVRPQAPTASAAAGSSESLELRAIIPNHNQTLVRPAR